MSLDTSNQEYCKELENYYNERSSLFLERLENMSNKKAKKEVMEIYNASRKNFIKNIREGYFVDDKYFNNTLDSLHKIIATANPETKDIRVLLELNDYVNAYNTGEDFVSIYIGLLNRLDNFYQLSYIICHEMAHQLLQHPINNLKAKVDAANSNEVKDRLKDIQKEKFNRTGQTELVLKDLIYADRKQARKFEIQADSLGMVLFNNAFPNRIELALSTLVLLDSVDVETDSLTEANYATLFNSPAQPFKASWLKREEFSGYYYTKSGNGFDIDSLKTHPDCKQRLEVLSNRFSKLGPINRELKKDYAVFRDRVQISLPVALYFTKQYGRSLYYSLVLLKNDPTNSSLKNLVYQNLLVIQEAQKKYTMNRFVDTQNHRFTNSYNTFLSFIRNLRKSEFENIVLLYKAG